MDRVRVEDVKNLPDAVGGSSLGIENVTGVFRILQEWETENRPDNSDGIPVRLP